MDSQNFYRIILFFFIALTSFSSIQCSKLTDSNITEVIYKPSDENILNPERGFFRFSRAEPGDPVIDQEFLSEIKQQFSLLSRGYYIEAFRESDFTEEFLNQIERDFQAIRDAGLKVYLRFNYNRRIGDADATLEQVQSHLAQLQPVFERNYDVIAVMAAGFIGSWGEWHASTNDLEKPENMRAVLYSILDALPEERSVVIRSPRHKMNVFETNLPLTREQAFDGSYIARAGHHNDCFLASDTDVGTYVPGIYPLFELQDTFSIQGIKDYVSKETQYLPMGGETCNPRPEAGDRFHCANALEEMDQLNWSFLNYNYSRQILDTWVDQGCMPEVERRLGYRFSMLDGAFSKTASPGGTFQFKLNMINDGFAAPYNPRGLQVVLRSVDNPENNWTVDLPDDPRHWIGGEQIQLDHKLGLPQDLTEGEYEVLFNLPDPTPSLRHRPQYSIHLANENTWEESTGFNALNHRLVIDSSSGQGAYDGDLTFTASYE